MFRQLLTEIAFSCQPQQPRANALRRFWQANIVLLGRPTLRPYVVAKPRKDTHDATPAKSVASGEIIFGPSIHTLLDSSILCCLDLGSLVLRLGRTPLVTNPWVGRLHIRPCTRFSPHLLRLGSRQPSCLAQTRPAPRRYSRSRIPDIHQKSCNAWRYPAP